MTSLSTRQDIDSFRPNKTGQLHTAKALQARYETHRARREGTHARSGSTIEALRGSDWQPPTCQYLYGEARQRMFCGDAVKPGKPYCEHHYAKCYETVLTSVKG